MNYDVTLKHSACFSSHSGVCFKKKNQLFKLIRKGTLYTIAPKYKLMGVTEQGFKKLK